MYFFREYNDYVVQLNLNEKTMFFLYKLIGKIKYLNILFCFFKIKYNIMPNFLDNNVINKNKLLFNCYFNNEYLIYSNSNKTYDVLYTYIYNDKNSFNYTFFLNYLSNSFKKKYYVECKKQQLTFLKELKISINRLKQSSLSSVFSDTSNITSLIDIKFYLNTNNYYIKKLYLSHVFFNL